jgi:hypothetical protein
VLSIAAKSVRAWSPRRKTRSCSSGIAIWMPDCQVIADERLSMPSFMPLDRSGDAFSKDLLVKEMRLGMPKVTYIEYKDG